MKLSKKWARVWSRRTLAGILAGSLCIVLPGLAKMEEKQEYNFDPVLVTAKRTESTDLKTAAAVQVISEQQLKATGASNLLEALKFATGITYEGYGRRGGLYGGMGSGLAIRGMKDRGTQVMINGVPISVNGDYALEHMPADNIERVEIIKGAASTLYGSAALSGVINIITKKTVPNSIAAETGSYGYNRQTISFQADKLSVTVARQKDGDTGQWGWQNKPNYTYTAFRGDTKDFLRWTWKISDKISFTHQYDQDDYWTDRVVIPASGPQRLQESTHIIDSTNRAFLEMQNGIVKSKLYYNGLVRDYSKPYLGSGASDLNTKTYAQTYGWDNQTNWKTPFAEYLLGLSWQKETYEVNDRRATQTPTNHNNVPLKQRDYYSVFGQITRPLSDTTKVIVGLRQEFIQQQGNLNNYSEFSPQIQFLFTPTNEQSWYINAARAFRMPKFSAMFGNSTLVSGNPDLIPESGYTYELGWKKIRKNDSLKLALFKMDYDNYTSWTNTGTTANPLYRAANSQFRNFGLEAEYSRALSKEWALNLGMTLSNPESNTYEPKTSKYSGWDLYGAKFQANVGLNYKKGKWSGAITAMFQGNREKSTDYPDGLSSLLTANLSLAYDFSPYTRLTLRVENLLDRNDILSSSSVSYPMLPRTYYLGLTQKF